jgi:DNA-directed RNA polymerase subunit RPC12/RpoP
VTQTRLPPLLLTPCNRCGAVPTIWAIVDQGSMQVRCSYCDEKTPVIPVTVATLATARAEAVAAWNRGERQP